MTRLVPLVVLPALFVAVLFLMRGSSLPFWQVFNLDPDYYYLLNGLRIVELLPPTDVSHPGTPVQVFVALVLRLMHPGQSAAALVEAVLDDPEGHLVAITTVMYPVVGLALFWMGRAFAVATGRLAPALLAQASPFLSMIIPKFGLHPKPESFLIVAVALLLVAALRAARAEAQSDRHAIWLGLALGFGIACKVQFVALGLVPLFLLDRRRLFVVLPPATIVGFLLFVSPAIPSYELWFDWLGRMMMHSGAYGAGAATVIDTGRYPRAVIGLFGSKLIFTVVLVASLVALAGYVRLRRRGLIAAEPLARLLGGLLCAQVLTVLLTAKQSAAHYMVPALMLTGAELAILFVLSARVFSASAHVRAWGGLAVVLAGVTVHAVWKQNAELARWTRDAQGFDMGRFAACARIDFDSSSSLPYAFLRGDLNAQGRYSAKLAGRMPANAYAWFINDHTWWRHGFMQWNRRLDIAEVVGSYPCVVFRGSQPYNFRINASQQLPGFKPDDTCEVGEETVFTKGIRCDGSPSVPLAN